MFVVAQFPVSDLRGLVPGQMGRLGKPAWGLAQPDAPFMRGFGPVSARNSSSLGMAGENFFADFDRAEAFRSRLSGLPLELKPWFRRFFFDGQVSGRFEFGFMSVGAGTGADIEINPSEIAEAIGALELEISIADTPPFLTSLSEAGKGLGLALLAATTERASLRQFPIAETFGVQLDIGDPTFHVRLVPGELAEPGRDSRRDTTERFGLWIASAGASRRQNVVVQRSESGTLDEPSDERAIRVIFAHLNAFVFALSQLERLHDNDAARIDPAAAKDVVPKLVERLATYAPSGPIAVGDDLLAAALRAFGEAYKGRAEALSATLNDYLIELNKPTAMRSVISYAQSMLELIITTAVKAGIQATLKGS
jgi:hypothetical protein